MKREATLHTKMGRLERRLSIEKWGAAGILELLWHVTARETPGGNIGKLPDEDIAYAIGWKGEAEALVSALADSGWLDRSKEHRLLVHDWPDHCDDAVHLKLARATLYFADGRMPSLHRMATKEREETLARYQKAQELNEQAHKERTEAHGERTALPCLALALPSQAEPGPPSAQSAPAKNGSSPPAYLADELYTDLVGTAQCWGAPITPEETMNAWPAWCAGSGEQKVQARATLQARIDAGDDPAFFSLTKFLCWRNGQYHKPVVMPRGRGKPTGTLAEREERLIKRMEAISAQ